MTFHPLANLTSFVTPTGSGDHTKDVDGFAYEYTTTSWYFLTGLDVMAPSDTVVVCASGNSITDGNHKLLTTMTIGPTCCRGEFATVRGTRSAS